MSSPMNQFTRRRLLVITGAAAATGLLRGGMVWATEGPSSYTPTWPSVDQHPPAPEWFQDAKFGIYFHWGVFSVPAFANEWYPRSMYINGSAENNHHKQVYGDPSAWPYHNFINGAGDKAGNWVQFAPKLKSAGGNLDPDEWAQLFVDAGAKFAGPVAEHHDGYSMWNSTVNEWNSVRTGPKLDLVRLHADAIRAKGLKFIVTLHHMYHFSGYFDQAPQQSTTSLRKLYGQLGWGTHEQLWTDKLREVIDGYQPDLIWQDGGLQYINESHRLNFLAHYYNQAVAWNKDVVTTHKDGLNDRNSVFDYERGGPAGMRNPYWLTDDSISSSSWCYTVDIGYYSRRSWFYHPNEPFKDLNQLLEYYYGSVGRNCNMLMNVAPDQQGLLDQPTVAALGQFNTALSQTFSTDLASGASAANDSGTTNTAGHTPDMVRDGNLDSSWQPTGTTGALVLTLPSTQTFDVISVQEDLNVGQRVRSFAVDSWNGSSWTQIASEPVIGHKRLIRLASPVSTSQLRLRITSSRAAPAIAEIGLFRRPGGGQQNGAIVGGQSGRCIDINGGSTANGARAQLWDCNGGTNQQWNVNANGTIAGVHSGLCLDASGYGTANGTLIHLWSCHGGTNQQWNLRN
jgi:alpha-L-fucosidase